MKNKPLTKDELAELVSVIGTEDELVASGEFSPGPWWGFNGIKILVVTRHKLLILQTGFALTARRDWRKTGRRSIDLTSIKRINSKRRCTFLGEAVVLHVRTNRKTQTFTTKYQEGENVVRALQAHLDRNLRD